MTRQKSWPRRVLAAYCATVLAFLVFPLLIIFPLSVSSASFFQFPPPGYSWRWYQAFFSSSAWIDATWLSIRVGAATTVLAVLLGVPVSFYLARARTRWLTELIDKVMVTPIIIPGMVTAIAVYSLLSALRLIGSFHSLVLGHLVL